MVAAILFMSKIGLRRPSLSVVPPGASLRPSLPVSADAGCVLTAMHMAFNRKIEQLSQTTDRVGDKADVVVELEGWIVRMVC